MTYPDHVELLALVHRSLRIQLVLPLPERRVVLASDVRVVELFGYDDRRTSGGRAELRDLGVVLRLGEDNLDEGRGEREREFRNGENRDEEERGRRTEKERARRRQPNSGVT